MRRSVSALVIVCSLGFAEPVFAQLLDQSFAIANPGARDLSPCYVPGPPSTAIAQTFTAATTGVLNRVQLQLWQRAPGVGRLQVSIFSTANGAPASAIQTLIFQTGPYPGQLAGGAFGDFPGFSVPVTAGQLYAIVVTVPTLLDYSTTFPPAWARSGGIVSYPGGQAFFTFCGGPGWLPVNDPRDDLGFRTYVTPPLLPPTNVTASQANSLTLSVTWTPPSAGPVLEGYALDFYSSGALVTRVLVGPGGSVSLPIPPGTSGSFQVTVSSRIGNAVSAPSSPAAFSLGSFSCAAPPAAPSGLTGSVTSGTGRVQWNAVPGATSYIVSAGSLAGASDLFNADVGNVTSVAASGLPGGFRAFVRVVAVSGCGRSGASVELELR